jgi:hypothetical protein
MTKNKDYHDFEILGQKFNYPNGWFELLSIFIVFSAIITIFYITFVKAESSNIHAFLYFFSGEIQKETKQINNSGTYIIGLWTPSPQTIVFFNNLHSKELRTQDRWESKATVQMMNDFGVHLKNKNLIIGYRRYETWGQGASNSSLFKPGYWWQITACKQVRPQDIVDEYIKYWRSNDDVYIEIIGPGGEYKR